MALFDTHMLLGVMGAALACGVVGLDRTAAGQFMISQPIVAAPLTGWMLGDPTAGLVVGAALELVWVLDMPVGTFVPADATIGAVSATAIAALGSPGGASLAVIGFSMLLTTAMTPLTMRADGLVRKWNSGLADKTLAAREGITLDRALARVQYAGLAFFFFKSVVLCVLFIPPGVAAVAYFGHLPDAFHRAMSLFVRLLPLLGVALVIRKLSMKTFDRYFVTGFVSAAVLGQAFHAPAPMVLLAVAAAGWMGAKYHERRA